MITENPLVSVCFTCYNRKKYVADALKSVLAQTYDPLEIVICDNASTDGTSEIVKKLVEDYQESGGSHIVNYIRHEKNIGGTLNIEHCYRAARGELLVAAHDDDISLPNRVEVIEKVWESSNRMASYISHPSILINSVGKDLSISHAYNIDRPSGAISTYSAKVTRMFDPYWEDDVWEDWIWAFRSRMVGIALYIDVPLVKYRIGTGISTSTTQYRKPLIDAAIHIKKGIRQAYSEMKRFKYTLSESKRHELEEFLSIEENRTTLILQQIASKTFFERYAAYRTRFRNSKFSRGKLIQFALTLPPWISDPMLNAYQYLKSNVRQIKKR